MLTYTRDGKGFLLDTDQNNCYH